MNSDSQDWLMTSVGHATPDAITVRGHDLANEVMGRMSFADLAFLLAAGSKPSEAEATLFNAVLVSLADHGLTPTALAARLTYTGAPEALQGAVAAGLLGGGSVFLGPVEDTARFLHEVLESLASEQRSEDAALRAAAGEAVGETLDAGKRIPGLGHPIHRETDPRTPRLYQLARGVGLLGPHMKLLEFVAAAHQTATTKALPINGAGAAGAVLADLGFPPPLTRGFALLARTAGLIGHLAEESERPIGMRLYKEVDARASGGAEPETP
ncbi:MAG: citryl-CoA lyase [Actinomycetota bacterium]